MKDKVLAGPLDLDPFAASDERLSNALTRRVNADPESLTNVARHAEAEGARVAIRRDGGTLRVEISDDGVGGADASGGTGIVGLRDRAEAAGGTLTVSSPAGRGTIVSAALPLTTGDRAAPDRD